jgi:hypothetical protein
LSFSNDLKRLCESAGDDVETVVRKTSIDLMRGMVENSPVDTGRFKGNWQTGFGAFNPVVTDPPNSDALGRCAVALETWIPGQTIWLTNALPYANRLEYGWSKQAQSGMVRLTVNQYGEYLKKQIAALP